MRRNAMCGELCFMAKGIIRVEAAYRDHVLRCICSDIQPTSLGLWVIC